MPKRKIIIILITIFLIFLFSVGGIVFILKMKAREKFSEQTSEIKSPQEIMDSLAKPSGENSEVSKEIMDSLGAPSEGRVSAEQILNSLNPQGKE